MHPRLDTRLPSMKLRRARHLLLAASILALLAALCACWIIPWRLRYQAPGCTYTFGYVGDEYNYAAQVQPFIAGTTATNHVNGIGDPRMISPFSLPDLCRWLLTVTGLEITTFVWIWRAATPLLLAAVLFWMARASIPARRKPWALPLAVALAAAALPALFCVYDVVTVFPPLQGFLNRFPTNIEYHFGAALLCVLLSFLRRPSMGRAVWLALLSAALVYLRPFAVMPLALTIAGCLLCSALKRETPLRVLAVCLGVLLAALLPWFLIGAHNHALPVYQQVLQRWFPPGPYCVHPRWPLFLSLGAALAASAVPLAHWRRWLALSAAAVMLALSFLPGLMSQSAQLLMFDRYGCYYLIVLVCVAMLAIAQHVSRWRGWRAWAGASRAVVCLAVLSLACSAALAARNLSFDFAANPGPYAYAVRELPYVPAYRWVAEHTPPDSLFLLDDGCDWSQAPLEEGLLLEFQRSFMTEEDLFPLIARRRRVYSNWLYGFGLSDQDLQDLAMLQRGTFGFRGTEKWTLSAATYGRVLKRFLPRYILWRRTAPIPRGFAQNLRPLSQKVYSDAVCEIWRLDYFKPPAL